MDIFQQDKYLIVIEGGGSTCRGLRYDLGQGRIDQRLILDQHPCNLHRNRVRTEASILTMLGRIGDAGGPLFLSLPGVSNRENVVWLTAQLSQRGWGPVYIVSDAVAALWGAFEEPAPGQGVFIGGTGCIALGYDGHHLWRTGSPETEVACGPWLAAEALKRVPHDPQLALFMGQPPSDPAEERHQQALRAPRVFAAAAAGNKTAQELLQEAATSIDAHLAQLRPCGIHDFALCGSIAQALRPWVKTPTRIACANGLEGALALGLSVYNNPGMLHWLCDLRKIETDSPLAAQA
ncbi:MAG: hypothetical protein HYS17_00230 [Micavibrio aeruginosavorus]|uniref:ATPase BadF/BadG/BcrA/BcrD type domain-containing protein n=1 Tax=Micavibrio aeruginosavorus TaxID=349221 RepID=A0A7T5UGT9_9BACT|nr:MAG: hypothetical protein HYS17_00230 [Micavibrio aeruginosavorus]